MPVTYDNSQPGTSEKMMRRREQSTKKAPLSSPALLSSPPIFTPLSPLALPASLILYVSLSPAPSLYAGLCICNRPKSQQRDAGGLYAVKSNKVKVIITLWEITLFVDRRRANYWVPKGLSEIIWANSNNFYLKVEAQTLSLCRVWSIQTIWHGPSFRS